jgi:hypothetical protein
VLFARIVATTKQHKDRGLSSIVVVDDMMAEIKSGAVGTSFTELVVNGRHNYTTVWVLTQGIFSSGGGSRSAG